MQFVSSEKLFFLVAWSIWSYEIGIWIFPSYIQEIVHVGKFGYAKTKPYFRKYDVFFKKKIIAFTIIVVA